jgi:hypothetical protein
VFCREHALQLQRDQDRFSAAGAEVVVVGLGSPARAAAFKAETSLPFRLLVSPDRAAYRAMDLERGTNAEVLGLRALASVPRAVRGGGSWRWPKQDWHQLGGTFVIAPGGKVAWAKRATHSGDNASTEQIEAALRAVSAEEAA